MTSGTNRQQVEQEHFDRLAEEQGEIWWGSATVAGVMRLQRRARLLGRELQAYPEPRVLELGTGTGAFAQYLLAEQPALHLDGIDVSPKSIEVATKKLTQYGNARFRVGDATALAYEAETLDAVVGNSVLHHIPLTQGVAEAYRVLKPGGLFWFSEPNMMNPEAAIEKNVRFIGSLTQTSPHETAFFRWPLRRMLRNTGFRRVSVEPFDFLHPLVPRALVRAADFIGGVFEHVPLLREISGSLLVKAFK